MPATVKCDTIKEVNSSVDNLVLDSSGNVTIGNNLTVTGTTTQTGSTTFTGPTYFPNGSVSAPSIAHAGDTNCGLYFGTDTIYAATAGTNALTIDSSQNMTVANTLVMGSSFKRNRIINGDMRVDQRNAGASVSTSALNTQTYTIDRWGYYVSATSKFTMQQNAGSVTPPTGFTNYLGMTSSSAYTVASGDILIVRQPIEGLNVSDLGWGSANAKTVTLSFWVRSSLTGTFGGSICNDAGNRSYPFSYSIGSANTWTQISITVSGDTTGTWLTTNGVGMYVQFSIGTGTTYSGTAGSWASSFYSSATGATSVVGTNGATFYITGVQLEVGSIATPYERQIYSDQLAQCQRYFYILKCSDPYQNFANCTAYTTGTSAYRGQFTLPPQFRANPTLTVSGTLAALGLNSGTTAIAATDNGGYPIYGFALPTINATSTGASVILRANNDSNASINFSSEL